MRAFLVSTALAACAHAHVLPRPRLMTAAVPRSHIMGRAAASSMPGGSNLYRQFGITEDAAYDEILEAYERLCAKSVGNKKELIKLEVAKDRILEDRLRRRMSGTLNQKVTESAWDRAQRMRKRKPLNEYLPSYVRQFVEIPSDETGTNMAIIFGLLSGMSMLAPQLASTGMSIGFLLACGIVYNKGLPEKREDDGRPAQIKPLLLTLGICLILGGLGFSLGVTLASALFPDSMRVRNAARLLRPILLTQICIVMQPRGSSAVFPSVRSPPSSRTPLVSTPSLSARARRFRPTASSPCSPQSALGSPRPSSRCRRIFKCTILRNCAMQACSSCPQSQRPIVQDAM